MSTSLPMSSQRIASLAAVAVLSLGGVVSGALSSGATPIRAGLPVTAVGSQRAPQATGIDLSTYADPVLGPNTLLLKPTMSSAEIRSVFDTVAERQRTNQFGPERYAILFAPGHYGTTADPITVEVGYGTQVAGIGRTPADVVVTGSINVYNQCDANGCIALNNFWRSLSHLTINVAGGEGCRKDTEFWAVSQAAPMRDVVINGKTTLMDYCTAGPQYASGGFIANSTISGDPVINGTQQQFLVRNSTLPGWTNGVWNQTFVGTTGAPADSFPGTDPGPYTTLPTTSVMRETPHLVTTADGQRAVLVPGVRRNSSGPATETTGERLIPLSQFFVATPRSSAAEINRALTAGRHLLLTPGSYSLNRTITVPRADTVVLGIGLPALSRTTGGTVLETASVPGVTVSGLMIDTVRRSNTLLQIGDRHGAQGGKHVDAQRPTLISDVFLRVGGPSAGSTTTAMRVSASNVVLDHIWAWRADHGAGVGWTTNPAAHGLEVTGDDVTAYGLFVEHFQREEVIWTGERGRVVFFQNEKPYDVPSQAAWRMSRSVNGFPAFQVGRKVRNFEGWAMGSYSFFNQGQDIHTSMAFMVPKTPGVSVHHLLTRWLNADGGIDSVVNGVGDAVNPSNPGPATVTDYPAR